MTVIKTMETKFIKFISSVPDYEHTGDLARQISYIKSNCESAKDFDSWQEIDSEAEHYYKEDYGELDEHIYVGYVTFYAPESEIDNLKRINCYKD